MTTFFNARAMVVMHCLTLIVSAMALAPTIASAQDEVIYYYTDAVGSVRMTTDASGVIIARYDYLPFGETWPTTPPNTSPDVRQFAGMERDAESGLDYFGARYYRGQSGRFTSVDPVFAEKATLTDPQLWNRYSYVRNNPLRFVDPDGRCIWDLCVAETAAVIGVSQATVAATYAAGAAALVAWENRHEIAQSLQDLNLATGMALRRAVGSMSQAVKVDPYGYPENYPVLDRTGKAHTPNRARLPDSVPRGWTREMLEDAATTLRKSIGARNEEAQRLGEDAGHRRRINEEERFLRQIDKALKELR